MKNSMLIAVLVISTQIDAATSYVEQAQQFANVSANLNSTIKQQALEVKADPTNAKKVSDLALTIDNKQDIGASSRPQAFALEDYIAAYTAQVLDQKRQAGDSSPVLTGEDVENISIYALLAYNQRA